MENIKVRKLTEFCDSLQSEKLNISWSIFAEECANRTAKLKSIFEQPEFSEFQEKTEFNKRFDALIDVCTNSDFQIAFVGTIKAGKSTLINAILGQDIASARVTPETAVLTKFRHARKNYIKVKFYTRTEWQELWQTISNRADVFKEEYANLNGKAHENEWINHSEYERNVSESELKSELERWSSSKHVEHYFVKEIEVGLEKLNIPDNVVFVDTPGLDDPVQYRSDVTRNYIKRANAVFVCVTAHAMTGAETKIIYSVFANSSSNEKIFIIGTQVDNLNNPKNDWEEQHKEWVKYLSDSACYGNTELASSHILPTAGYMENLCREYEKDETSLDEEDMKSLSSLAMKYGVISMTDMMQGKVNFADAIHSLRKLTNLDVLNYKIQEDILRKYRQFLDEDIKKTYMELKQDLRTFFTEQKSSQEKLLAISEGDVAEIRERYAQAKEKAEFTKQTKEQLIELVKVMKEDNEKRMKNLKEKISELTD